MEKNKKSMQDIVPGKHRSIRDIPLPGEMKNNEKPKRKSRLKVTPRVRKVVKKVEKLDIYGDTVFKNQYVNNTDLPRRGRVFLWIVGIVCVIGVFFGISSFFHKATVEIKVKNISTPIDVSAVMLQNATTTNSLSFDTVTVDAELGQAIKAQGEKQVSVKATGRVVVYNKNTIAQKLISQTRLTSAGGKIYRLPSTITVPAGKKSGTSVIPGSIEVAVIADQPGADYNSPLTDFTFPGFNGSAKFTTVYARSKTEISGGASGTVKVASPDDLAKATSELKDKLEDQLLKNSEQQKPDAFMLIPNLYSVKFGEITQSSKDDAVLIKEKAQFTGVLVNTSALVTYLASQAIQGYSKEPVHISNLKDLSFVSNVATSTLSSNTKSIIISIKGTPNFVYEYDAQKLKQDLVGMSRESLTTIISTYTGIEKVNAVIEPFWKSRFPEDIGKISIKEQ